MKFFLCRAATADECFDHHKVGQNSRGQTPSYLEQVMETGHPSAAPMLPLGHSEMRPRSTPLSTSHIKSKAGHGGMPIGYGRSIQEEPLTGLGDRPIEEEAYAEWGFAGGEQTQMYDCNPPTLTVTLTSLARCKATIKKGIDRRR